MTATFLRRNLQIHWFVASTKVWICRKRLRTSVQSEVARFQPKMAVWVPPRAWPKTEGVWATILSAFHLRCSLLLGSFSSFRLSKLKSKASIVLVLPLETLACVELLYGVSWTLKTELINLSWLCSGLFLAWERSKYLLSKYTPQLKQPAHYQSPNLPWAY